MVVWDKLAQYFVCRFRKRPGLHLGGPTDYCLRCPQLSKAALSWATSLRFVHYLHVCQLVGILLSTSKLKMFLNISRD